MQCCLSSVPAGNTVKTSPQQLESIESCLGMARCASDTDHRGRAVLCCLSSVNILPQQLQSLENCVGVVRCASDAITDVGQCCGAFPNLHGGLSLPPPPRLDKFMDGDERWKLCCVTVGITLAVLLEV
ncbi:hypothetical protein E2C01_057671 [Portunus trituberculatus]|uniref:Uncharacterized protein n=1 Tax=Portunus trituberculatus TaxID=210409 RepID=A0A5B7GXN4_PORTR|nr:hypothetical protein [Portunus trituberculatus]